MADRTTRRLFPRRKKPEVLDGHAPDQVFLDDPLQHRLGAAMVPDALWPHDCDRPGMADLEAIGLGAGDAAVAVQAELLDPPLQVFPSRGADLQRAAFALLRF